MVSETISHEASPRTRLLSNVTGLNSRSTWVVVCVVVILCYLVPKLTGVLISDPKTVWPLWPGCAILVSGLLMVPLKVWPLHSLAQNSTEISPKLRNAIMRTRDDASLITNDIHTLSHRLHSQKLELLGVAAAMRAFCRDFSSQVRVEIDFEVHDLPSPVPAPISLCLYRVLQEGLQNGVKHSGVRQFDVALWGASGEIHLTVSDRGVGFDPKEAKEGDGLGLVSMHERVQAVQGRLSIESQPKRGTTIHARVSVRPNNASIRATG